MKTYSKPHNNTKRILLYKFDHPNHSVRKIATALTITYQSVYNSLYNYDALGSLETLGHLPDLIGDFKDTGKIVKAAKKVKALTDGQQVLREVLSKPDPQVANLQDENEELQMKIEVLEAVIQAAEIQRRGLENVITYLESKLGIDEIDARLEALKD